MKTIILIVSGLFMSLVIAAQQKKHYAVSVSGGKFEVGRNVPGIWVAAGIEKRFNRLAVIPEIFFENGASKATVTNPTIEQFFQESFFHESNTGLGVRVVFYPFKGWAEGLYASAGPLAVYTIRTTETRAELVQYPSFSLRMVQLMNEHRLAGGIRVTAGYDIYFAQNWLAGVRIDFVKYSLRDLNTLPGVKLGYRL
ncbi:MAG TPA: hypothetical protein VD996_08705 [Chitinophagaceae bacterium]|nr:hypothetical protein [Chitinophagaceae bacterium]